MAVLPILETAPHPSCELPAPAAAAAGKTQGYKSWFPGACSKASASLRDVTVL